MTKKDIPRIMIAHDVPYVGTASIGHPADLLRKLEKVRDMKGFRYLQVFAPCPTGWRMAPEKTIESAKMAVDCGMWTLFEYENGKFTINKRPKMTPINDYIKIQGRFGHFTEDMIDELQKWANHRWEILQKMEDVEEE